MWGRNQRRVVQESERDSSAVIAVRSGERRAESRNLEYGSME